MNVLLDMIVGKNAVIISILALLFQGKELPVVLFFGDSLTAGYGLTVEEAFPACVGRTLQTAGVRVKIVNAGLSGETSAGGLSRIDWILRQPIDVFVLELGANDGLRGLPLAQTKSNLQGIIDKVRAKNADVKIVLAGMQVPPNMGPDYSRGFQDVFRALARENQILLIPFLLEGVAGRPELNQTDGIHPNAEGHQKVGMHVAPFIAKALGR